MDAYDTARFQLGPIRYTPSIQISNVGVDNNVFDEADNQRSDTTALVGPAVDVWARLGSARLAVKSSGQYQYFKTYDDQRGWNTRNGMQLDLPMTRVRPFLELGYLNARERTGYEIDTRPRRHETLVRFGSDVRLSGRTSFVLSADRASVAFNDGETFQSTDLSDALNRYSTTEHLQFRYILTPLTTLVVNTNAVQDRFDVTDERNANSVIVMSGFEMKPFALISGSALVGVRRYNALDARAPDFNGLVASVNAHYTVLATRADVHVGRDVAYSYLENRPYYNLTDIGLSVTERITRVWDVVGRVGRQVLDYKTLTVVPPLPPRVDHTKSVGGSIGYRVGQTLHVGFDANYFWRDAAEFASADYKGLRAGISISYGIPQ